jgi:uncharacterized membrane protein HdeD (DUF308 family)
MAVGLGAMLLLQPEKTQPILANFMGAFWLVSGLMSLRWGVGGQRAKGLWLVAGVVGVLVGATVLGRNAAQALVPLGTLISAVGLVILLTGILHIVGGFRIGEELTRQRSFTSVLLGVFEVVLGLLLVIAPLDQGLFVYLVMSVWALLGGLILIGDALRVRRLSQQGAEASQEIEQAS